MKDNICREAFGYRKHKCYICGKAFEAKKDYVFKYGNEGHKMKYFCSWHCMRAHEKTIKRKKAG